MQDKKRIKIGLLGASFDTGNHGVSALAESSIKCILNRWPNAKVAMFGAGRKPGDTRLSINVNNILLRKVPVRFCKNIFIENHFLILLLYHFLYLLIPVTLIKNILLKSNTTFKALSDTDLFCDITGGDSFSDIYGMKRFSLEVLTKWLIILTGKPFMMLPQTYEPFRRHLTKVLASYILRNTKIIYSRDNEGVNVAQRY